MVSYLTFFILPLIEVLLLGRSPPQVSGLVVPVVINTVDGIIITGAVSYVSQHPISRSIWVCEPKFDTTPTVVFVAITLFIGTSVHCSTHNPNQYAIGRYNTTKL